MRGIQFNNYHSADDWGLILTARNSIPPTPKYVRVSVDGRDGDLNLSRVLTGEIRFNNRVVYYSFIATEGSQEEREELISFITNELHGQEIKIIEPDDPTHYLIGDVEITNVVNNRAYSTFDVMATCEPYRYAINDVNRVINLTNTETNVVITNAGTKTLIPTVIVDGTVNLTIGSSSIALSSGTYKLTDLTLKKGATVITVKGEGTLNITYKEAVI
jgi:hypothetical protein